MSKIKTWVLGASVLVAMLALSACFAGADKLKQNTTDLLEQATQNEHPFFQGHFSLTGRPVSSFQESRWHWSGGLKDGKPLLVWQGELPPESEITVLFSEQQMYVHIPELNSENEYFIAPSPYPPLPFTLSPYAEAASVSNGDAFAESAEESGRTISVRIGENDLPAWLNALENSLNALPSAVRNAFFPLSEAEFRKLWTDTAWAEDGAFEIRLNDTDEIETYALRLRTTLFDVEWHQSLIAPSADEPLFEPPEISGVVQLEDVLVQLHRLAADESGRAGEVSFTPGLEDLEGDDYAEDAKRQNIVDTIKASLQALIDRDRERFDAAFRKPAFAERHDELWERERQYRFLNIEDLSFKSLSGSVRVSVLYEYMEAGDESATLSGLIFVLNRDEQGLWKIDRID